MTDPKDFQKERLEWSRWKHAILESYLERFSGILQRHETIYAIDGFAGPGVYEDGQEGSPLYSAKVAARLYDRDRWYELRCINIEKDARVFENLVKSTTDYTTYVTNLHGEFADFIPQILNIIGMKPALFFLDPIGLKGLEWSKLQSILRRGQGLMDKAVTELLIRYDAQTALRLTGFETSDDVYKESYLHTFNSILGVTSSEYWKNFVAPCKREDVPCMKQKITEAYQSRLKEHFEYVLRMPIRSRDNRLQYYLIFATRSLKGVVAMNDTLYQVEGMRAEDIAASQIAVQKPLLGFERPEDLPEDQRNLLELNTLKEYILEILQKRPDRQGRRDDLRAIIAMEKDCLGRFSRGHYTIVLGGTSRTIKTPKDFKSLKSQIILDPSPGKPSTPGEDTVYIKLL